MILGAGDYSLKTLDDSELVVLTTDVSAPVFTGGMFSGNVVPPR